MNLTNNSKPLFIVKLHATSFLSYDEFKVDLSNVNFIYGEYNGSGKTTVAHLISFILTGNTLAKIPISEIIKKGSNKCVCDLICVYGSQYYRIERTLSINTSGKITKYVSLRIYDKDGKLDSVYSGSVAENILRKFISYNTLQHLIYLNGHDILNFINMPPASKSKFIDTLLNINYVDTIMSVLPNYLKDLKELEDKIESLHNPTLLSFDMEKYNDEKNNVTKRIDNINKSIKLLEAQYESMQRMKEEYDSIVYTITKYNETIKSNEMRIKNNEEMLQTLKNNELSLLKIRKEIEFKYKINDITDLESKIASIMTEIKSIKKDVELKKNIDLINQYIRENNITKCPICNSKIDNNAITPDNTDSITDYKSSITELVDELERLNNIKNKYSVIMNKIENIENRIGEITNEIKSLKDANKNLKDRINRLHDSIPNMDTAAFNELRKNILKLKNEKNTLYLKLSDLDARYDAYKQISLELHKHDLEKLNKEYETLSAKQKFIEYIKDRLNEIRKTIRHNFIKQITPIINKWIEYLTKDAEYNLSYELTLSKNTRSQIQSTAYDENIYLNNSKIRFESLSSGQKAVCLLSLIMALHDLSEHESGFIIFDEIQTSGIDDKTLNKLIELIKKISQYRQIIFIDRDKSLLSKVIDSFKDVDDIKTYKVSMQRIGMMWSSVINEIKN